jgi:hypothetical protein
MWLSAAIDLSEGGNHLPINSSNPQITSLASNACFVPKEYMAETVSYRAYE